MSAQMSRADIVIVNHNAGSLLDKCVDGSLQQATRVILVDNASTDGSCERVARDFGQHPRLTIIRSDVNLGFAAGCNIGAAATESEFVLFLNPDCELQDGAVRELVDALESHAGAGMAGGLLLDEHGREQGGARRTVPTPWRSFVRAFGLGRFRSRWPRLFAEIDLLAQPLPEFAIEMEAISGACTMVRRQALRDVGAWDEGYFLHCEDLDLCMRYRQAGWTILFVPSARIVHHRGACSRARPFFVEWHKHHGMIRFYRKFFRHQYPGILMGLVWIGVWVRFVAVASAIVARRIGLVRMFRV